MRIDKNTTIRLGDRNIVKVKLGDVVIWQKSTEPVVGPDYFYIESLGDGNTISVKNQGDGSTSGVTPTLEYSTDKNTWNTITFDWTSGEHTTELPVKLNTGEKMYFRNDTRKFSSSFNIYISFSSSVSSNVGGDIRTLSNYLDVNNETTPQTGMFCKLFYNNKYIVDASNLRLSYTTLANSCYFYMFSGCSKLTSAPALPATTLADYCYSSMFRDCTSLTTAPTLPATTLAIHCYSNMFWGCSKLTTAPELPATNLASNCYYYMFNSCTSLVTAPELPATTLANNCYESMFSSCTSLVTAPSLPATTLARYCYSSMFISCNSLTTAPELPSTTLADYCYQFMFYNCSSLNNLTVYADDISASSCTNNWLKNVASSGTFNNYGSATYATDSPSGIPTGWTEVKPVDETDYFYIESLGDGNTVSVVNKGDGNTTNVTPTLEYSTDKNTWNTITFDWTSGNHTTELPVKLNTGGKMYFRNDTRKFSGSYNNYITFSPSVSSNVGGDIRTLSNYLDVNSETKPQTGMFCYLFKDNKNIVDASNLRLPYTTLANDCYGDMFYNCTALTSAPALPATKLSGGCYNSMFNGCTSLTTAPELAATMLKYYCYQYMFNGCSKLNNITVYADDISASSCTTNWLSGVASTGTFNNMGFAPFSKGASGIPTGWTEITPEIQSITANPDTFTIEFNNETVTCNSTLEVVTTTGTLTKTNSVTLTVGENTGNTTRTITKTIPYFNSSYDVTIVQSAIQSITANPDTFTIKSYKDTAKCRSTLTITTTLGTTVTDTNTATITVGENTGDTTRTLTETIPYKGSSYQITIVQTANDPTPTWSWNVESTGTYPFELNTNDYYESTNKGHGSSYSYATLNYSGFDELILECINSGESNYDYGIISQPDVLLSESTSDDGVTGSTKVFKNFKGQSSTNPVQLTIPSDKGSHFITIKFRKDSIGNEGNDSFQFKVIEP